MQNKERVFFILYDTGETFYFNISPEGYISCKNKGMDIIGNSISIKENVFTLDDIDGNTLYGFNLDSSIDTSIQQIYIDEDVFRDMYDTKRLSLDEDAMSKIYGIDISDICQKTTKTRVKVK